jgi:hypothetical protein
MARDAVYGSHAEIKAATLRGHVAESNRHMETHPRVGLSMPIRPPFPSYVVNGIILPRRTRLVRGAWTNRFAMARPGNRLSACWPTIEKLHNPSGKNEAKNLNRGPVITK